MLSDSTTKHDRGVGESWIVDADAQTIEQFLLKDGRYPRTTRRLNTGRLASRVIAGFTLPVRAAFDDAANLAALRQFLG